MFSVGLRTQGGIHMICLHLPLFELIIGVGMFLFGPSGSSLKTMVARHEGQSSRTEIHSPRCRAMVPRSLTPLVPNHACNRHLRCKQRGKYEHRVLLYSTK